MNLIVDIGNTSTKLAVFKNREKISVSRITELSCEEIEKKLSGLEIK
jgi:pantothenate kinase type III